MRKIIEYPWNGKGRFIERKNRFLGIVDVENKLVEVHIHDSGRLEELLFEGNNVLIRKSFKRGRKTEWDLVLARFDKYWIPVNSSFHRKISEVLINNFKIFGEAKVLKPEFKFMESRVDFFIERKEGDRLLVEVKGCTLSKNVVALFPDAPTLRGAKHVKTLIESMKHGFKPYILILVLRPDSKCFLPNRKKDPYFAKVFYKGLKEGVKVKPILIEYKDGWLYYKGEIPICERRINL